jgi:hypothetical protein
MGWERVCVTAYNVEGFRKLTKDWSKKEELTMSGLSHTQALTYPTIARPSRCAYSCASWAIERATY